MSQETNHVASPTRDFIAERFTMRVACIILVLSFSSSCSQASRRMAGWGFIASGAGLTTYTAADTAYSGARFGSVDGGLVGARLAAGALVAVVGAALLFSGGEQISPPRQQAVHGRSSAPHTSKTSIYLGHTTGGF